MATSALYLAALFSGDARTREIAAQAREIAQRFHEIAHADAVRIAADMQHTLDQHEATQ